MICKSQVSLEATEELYKFLQGETPEGLRLKSPPKLPEETAFGIAYYLQEVLHIIPDVYERCETCGDLYDSDYDGVTEYGLRCESCCMDVQRMIINICNRLVCDHQDDGTGGCKKYGYEAIEMCDRIKEIKEMVNNNG